jgi:hypothetical protein
MYLLQNRVVANEQCVLTRANESLLWHKTPMWHAWCPRQCKTKHTIRKIIMLLVPRTSQNTFARTFVGPFMVYDVICNSQHFLPTSKKHTNSTLSYYPHMPSKCWITQQQQCPTKAKTKTNSQCYNGRSQICKYGLFQRLYSRSQTKEKSKSNLVSVAKAKEVIPSMFKKPSGTRIVLIQRRIKRQATVPRLRMLLILPPLLYPTHQINRMLC